jgi:iron(III) transport system permease protein
VVALLLLAPAVLTFAVDRWVSRKQTAMLTARAVPYRPRPRRCATGCSLPTAADRAADAGDAGHGGVRVLRQLLALQPQPSLRHYTMGLVDAEVGEGFVNSLRWPPAPRCSAPRWSSSAPTCWRRPAAPAPLRGAVRLLAMLPMAVPGLVLGLGYIFFFNEPGQPAERAVPHDDAADAVHHRALLHHRPPDGGDGAEGAGRRVRGRLGSR